MDVILKPATVWLRARALNLRLYPSSLHRVGSRRLRASQTEQGSPHRSLPLRERTVSVLGWLHHFLTLYAALYISISAVPSKNAVSFRVCINTSITVLVCR